MKTIMSVGLFLLCCWLVYLVIAYLVTGEQTCLVRCS